MGGNRIVFALIVLVYDESLLQCRRDPYDGQALGYSRPFIDIIRSWRHLIQKYFRLPHGKNRLMN